MATLGSCGFILWVVFASSAATFMATSAAGSSSLNSSSAILIEVDQSGKGDYKKIQDAIDAVPSNNVDQVYILIKPGIYREKIVVPAGKPYITLGGTNANSTVITWNMGGSNLVHTPTVSVLASNFVARYLTFQNTYGAGAQAVALQVAGDKAAFYGCRILSYQDTLLDDVGRHYYSNCYIEGAIDFICGNGLSLYDKCHLHSLSDVQGAITAQQRSSPTEDTGYSFINSKITGVGTSLLGRPWGAYSRVVFAYSYMGKVILPQGWDDWNDPSKQKTAFYGEYRNYGPGSSVTERVRWSHQLTSIEAASFLTKSLIDGSEWLRPFPRRFRKPSWK
ncbi:hypothetical protein MRB53_018109 [Persea americana]|uniref:Uncharacterized protein n=1 Tax=Persea americana TaxID=3435 RepID=A0ACC2M726_PERAE|nr:hypothetical protein MRB53_018109 [Persea americana]